MATNPNEICLYCGRKTGSTAYEYCRSCIVEGYANVNKVTGRTNGWDKPWLRGKKFDMRRGA